MAPFTRSRGRMDGEDGAPMRALTAGGGERIEAATVSFFFLSVFFSLLHGSQSLDAEDPAAVITPRPFVYATCLGAVYHDGSTHQPNVESVISSLTNAAPTSLYANFTSDAASRSSPVYGLFQCQGNLAPSDCRACVLSALSQLHPYCGSTPGATVQLDGCLIRYGKEPFVGVLETNVLLMECGPAPPNRHDATFARMRDETLSAVASSRGAYRVGEAGYIRAISQCVGDLSDRDCSDCVSNAVGQLKCSDSLSGEVYLGKCFVKYNGGAYSSSGCGLGGFKTGWVWASVYIMLLPMI